VLNRLASRSPAHQLAVNARLRRETWWCPDAAIVNAAVSWRILASLWEHLVSLRHWARQLIPYASRGCDHSGLPATSLRQARASRTRTDPAIRSSSRRPLGQCSSRLGNRWYTPTF